MLDYDEIRQPENKYDKSFKFAMKSNNNSYVMIDQADKKNNFNVYIDGIFSVSDFIQLFDDYADIKKASGIVTVSDNINYTPDNTTLLSSYDIGNDKKDHIIESEINTIEQFVNDVLMVNNELQGFRITLDLELNDDSNGIEYKAEANYSSGNIGLQLYMKNQTLNSAKISKIFGNDNYTSMDIHDFFYGRDY